MASDRIHELLAAAAVTAMSGSRISHAKENVSHRLAYAIEIIEDAESSISRNRLFSKPYFQFRFAGFPWRSSFAATHSKIRA